jgi:hypothetical protein
LRNRKARARAKVTPKIKSTKKTTAKVARRNETGDRTKGENNKPAEEVVEKNRAISRQPVDIARVRMDILNMVGNSAVAIATAVINSALAGDVARAKYLFEIAGVYPATVETGATNPEGGSLAHVLLKRMGLPTEPVIPDGDSESTGGRRDEGADMIMMSGGDDVE